ncbi:MAG: hypothetical protein HEQ35_16695 [Gloeotrichia echinulata IR180]
MNIKVKFEELHMLPNFCKNSTLTVLSIGLLFTQFGCKAIISAAKNTNVWGAVIAAISAGTAIRAEARASDRDQKSDEVTVTISLSIQQPDNTTKYSEQIVYVNCRDLGNDSAIIERNNITYEGEPLTPSNQKIIADYIRKSASPVCEKKLNGV